MSQSTKGTIGWGTDEEFVSAPPGVHKARYSFVDDEMKDYDWSEQPRVFLNFELVEEQNTAKYSVQADDELVFVVWQLTGKRLDVGTPEQMFKSARKALDNCHWQGLVLVGKSGFVRSLQLPTDVYKFRFLQFTSRDQDTGKPHWIVRTFEGKESKRTFFEVEVVEGSYTGWRQTGSIPLSFQSNSSTGDLNLSGHGLVALLRATGITPELLDSEVQEAGSTLDYFEDITNPLPELERLMIRIAAGGFIFGGSVDDKGYIPWASMVPATPGQPLAARPTDSSDEIDLVCGMVTQLAQQMWGKNIPVFDAAGNLVADGAGNGGLYLGKYVVVVLAEAFPESGIEKRWPPDKWANQDGFTLIRHVFSGLLLEDEGTLISLVGSSQQSQGALVDWTAKNFLGKQVDEQGVQEAQEL